MDQDRLLKKLEQHFDRTIEAFEVKPLAGDASARCYYRLSWAVGGTRKTVILMAMADTAGAKTSEEIIGTTITPISELPFINIQKHLRLCKVRVPEILFYAEEDGWLCLEDLGDVTFSEQVEILGGDQLSIIALYRQAIDIMISMQLFATTVSDRPTLAHVRSYDQKLFEWEFEHFIEYGIEKRNGFVLPPKDRQQISAHFSDLSAHFASLPQFFTHRDYHSKNLMVQPEGVGHRLTVIDFQDALMGPAEYDLASLLRDSYIDLSDEVIETLLSYYISCWKERAARTIDLNLFRESFDLISIQRNLKAAGRFVFIDQVKGKDHLLPFVRPTLLKVKQTLQKYERLRPLTQLLDRHIPEFNL